MNKLTLSCFYLACFLFFCLFALSISRVFRKSRSTSHHFLQGWIVGLFLITFILHFPMYYEQFSGNAYSVSQSILVTAHHTTLIFFLNEESSAIREFALANSLWIPKEYSLLAVMCYISAPLLTLSVVLSFFEKVRYFWDILCSLGKEVFIFTEVNEASLTLAESLQRTHSHSSLIFANCIEDLEDSLGVRLFHLGAIRTRNDASNLYLGFFPKRKPITFLALNESNDSANQHSLEIIKKYSNFKNAKLYIFSESSESEMLFQESAGCNLRIRRIDPIRSFVYENLYQNGVDLFRNAVPLESGKRAISAVIIGLDRFGTEMLKALSWAGQMNGYSLQITAFDKDISAEDKLCALCPELMDAKHNNVEIVGEACYSIKIHSGISINSCEFEIELSSLPAITYVFISSEDESQNIHTAVKIREICERRNMHPIIQTRVTSSDKKEALANITNYRGIAYNIQFVGDTKSRYSDDVLLNSPLEQEALERHLKWGDEQSFWAYEFNYRSSLASAIHQKLRFECDMPGATKTSSERTNNERLDLSMLEHKRWNAYMRSEGYRFSGSIDPRSRNDLAKLHNCLVPYSMLPEKERLKDDI